MEYHFRYHRSRGGGYWAQCVEIPGCITQGESLPDLGENMADALNLMLEEPSDSRQTFNLPRRQVRGRNVAKVPVSPKVAFAFLLRQLRLRAGLTQQEASRRLGFENIYSYQRLESSGKANPRLDLIVRLKSLFPDFDLGLIVPRCPLPGPEQRRR